MFGQPATFTALVSSSSPFAVAPTGTVTFEEGGTPLPGNSTVTLLGGTASFATASMPVGSDPITAVYNGGSQFSGSSSAATLHTVALPGTTATIDDALPTTLPGQTAVFTATVAPVVPGAGMPTGTVTFEDDGVALAAPVTLVGGSAQFSLLSLAAGTHSITAVYSGDGNFAASTSAAALHVVLAVTTTTSVQARRTHRSSASRSLSRPR